MTKKKPVASYPRADSDLMLNATQDRRQPICCGIALLKTALTRDSLSHEAGRSKQIEQDSRQTFESLYRGKIAETLQKAHCLTIAIKQTHTPKHTD